MSETSEESSEEFQNEQMKKPKLNSMRKELRLFLELAIPTTILNVGFIASPLMTASHVGRKFGPVHLSGFTLATLTGNICTFSLMYGLLNAADTLGPQAYGVGNKKQVGLIAMRGFTFAIALLLPISVILVISIKDILIALGQDEEASTHASDWYRIFVWSFPFGISYSCIWKFLSAQHIMKPMILASVFSVCIVLPLALDVLTKSFGFVGSAYAYVVFHASQAILLVFYLWWKEPYDKDTWPGFQCWREAIFQYKPMMEFIHLGLGGMFAQSEWIFWEAIGLVIGLLGVVPLSVHTIPNQMTQLLCLAPFSAGTAVAIRIGHTLPLDVNHAKRIALTCISLTTAFFVLVNVGVYILSDWIIGLFTKDEEVMELANAVWWKVCVFNTSLALFGAHCGVANGLGMQWTLAGANIFWLWVVGLPAIYYMAYIREGGVECAWSWINFPYLGMNSCLIVAYATTDWQKVADKIQEDGDAGIEGNTPESIPLVYERGPERKGYGSSIHV